jgi:hypothetical protein
VAPATQTAIGAALIVASVLRGDVARRKCAGDVVLAGIRHTRREARASVNAFQTACGAIGRLLLTSLRAPLLLVTHIDEAVTGMHIGSPSS